MLVTISAAYQARAACLIEGASELLASAERLSRSGEPACARIQLREAGARITELVKLLKVADHTAGFVCTLTGLSDRHLDAFEAMEEAERILRS